MAPRGNDDFIPSAAENVVMDNFGDDFRASLDNNNRQQDDFGGDEGGDDGDDGERQPRQPSRRVSHTDEGDEGGDDEGARGYAADDDDDLGDNVLRMPRRDARDDLDDMRRDVGDGDDERRPLPRHAEVKADRNGNLVNAKTGKLVARAGAQARFYKNMRKAQTESAGYAHEAQDVSRRLNEAVEIGRGLHTELTELKAQQNAIKGFGFSPKDQISAMQLFQDFRADAEGTIRKILTRMAASGRTVRGMNDAGGFDTKAFMDTIREEIRRETAPVRERAEAERRASEARQQQEQGLNETRREVSNFFRRQPEARRYIGTFQQLMKRPDFSGMSLGEIWMHIKENRRQAPRGRQQTLRDRGSLPRGRANLPSGNRGTPIASLDQSYDNIIGGILDEQGYQRAV